MTTKTPPPSDTTKTPEQQQQQQTTWEYMTNRRSRKQASMFFLGATLFTLSTIVTRRSTFYRKQSVYPLFYKPSNVAPPQVNGQLEALRALQLATMNVISSTIMIGGGLLWAFDISSVDDLRTRIRSAAGVKTFPGTKSDKQIEEEFEEWLATTLARRQAKEDAAKSGEVGSKVGKDSKR